MGKQSRSGARVLAGQPRRTSESLPEASYASAHVSRDQQDSDSPAAKTSLDTGHRRDDDCALHLKDVSTSRGCCSTLLTAFQEVRRVYVQRYPPRILMMDAFCACLLFMASLLVMYAALTRTNFPFNAFLSAFISCTGTAVLTVCLRIQITNKPIFKLTEERALADFLLCNLLLHLAVFTFIG